jgi:hypothetical protein
MIYNLAAIRELVFAAFNDNELQNFCFAHFPTVYKNFIIGQDMDQRVRNLVESAERRGQIETLLDEVEKANSYQYKIFADKVRAEPPPQFAALTPNQAAALFTRTFDLLREVPAARAALIGAQASLTQTCQHIRLLAEYKGVHDLLQQLELSYRVVYDLLYEQDELLPAERVRWRGLANSQMALQTTIGKVCGFLATISFATDTAGWADELRAAQVQLGRAYGQRDVTGCGAAITAVADVVGGQLSRMNDRLIGALDALGLLNLLGILRQAQAAMNGLSPGTDATLAQRMARFAADLDALETLAGRLKTLRDEHDAWQQADNELRNEEALLGLSLERFKRRWERLARQLQGLCAGVAAGWARDLDAAIGRMSDALAPNAATDPLDAFCDCRSAVIQRFNQVDQDLKTLCDLLKEAGGPLDAMLEGLA